MASKIFFTSNTPNKLKHIALWEIYNQLINTCLIFSYNSTKKCCCDQFQGCWVKSLTTWLHGEKNYCYICRVKMIYNIEKNYKLKKISDIINTYEQTKEDLQLSIKFGHDNFWLYRFKTNVEIKKKKFSEIYLRYLKKFTIDGYYCICVYDS